MTIAHWCIHTIMAATVTRYLVTNIRFIESFFNTVSKYNISHASKLAFNLAVNFSFSRAPRRQFAGSYLAVWQPTDTHRKLCSSLICDAKMLNFGECGYCNIPHNFGIQRVTRFQLLRAQKSPLLSFALLFGQQLLMRTSPVHLHQQHLHSRHHLQGQSIGLVQES
jgi:hypothetical protein